MGNITLIQYASDLHLDTRSDDLNYEILQKMAKGSKEAEILLLVGDVAQANSEGWGNWLSFMSNHWHQVLIVPGNHEYWGLNWNRAHWWFEHWQKEYPQVQFLDNQLYKLPSGQKIAGSTLWYKDHPLTRAIAPNYNDFKHIEDAHDWIFQRGAESRLWLESLYNEPIGLIATHVPTDERLVKGDLSGLGRFFAHQLNYWAAPIMVSGHTHHPFEEKLLAYPQERLFLSNPLGYTDEPQFQTFTNKFIEL